MNFICIGKGGIMNFILMEKKKHVAVITINRPKSLNALNTEVMNELHEPGKDGPLLREQI